MPADTADTENPADDPFILDERAHLRRARTCLRAMRDRTRSLEALGGDPVSEEYLKAELHHRVAALADDPSTPLFFGRLDYRDPAERFYVGRRHVHDDAGDPVVIDWRADIARPFCRATPADPLGLRLRRRFGFSGGELTAYEDESFTGDPDPGGVSRILTEEIERPRSGPMRDIVATIQPDQDGIVRAELGETICVQGAPGTGKTAVGLHRAAYLLYAHRERLRRSGVLVIGPNRSFLSYIHQVLPALGELDVRQVTLDELVAHVPVRAGDPPHAAAIKGDARMAEVLRRAVWSFIRAPAEPLVVPRGSRRWRLPPDELSGMIDDLRARELRYGAARAMLPKLIASAVIARMEESGESPGERTAASLASAVPVKRFVDEVWPAVDPVRVVFRLFADRDALAAAADGLLDADEQHAVRGSARHGLRGARTGRRPTRCWSMRRSTWSSAPRTSVTSSSTRHRTSPPCSAVRSAGAAGADRRRCSATSRRARHRGRPRAGTPRWPTWANPPRPCENCGGATGSPARSSTMRACCSPTPHPTWHRRFPYGSPAARSRCTTSTRPLSRTRPSSPPAARCSKTARSASSPPTRVRLSSRTGSTRPASPTRSSARTAAPVLTYASPSCPPRWPKASSSTT